MIKKFIAVIAFLIYLAGAAIGESNEKTVFLYLPSAEEDELKCFRLDIQLARGESAEAQLVSQMLLHAYEGEAVLTGCYSANGIVNLTIETKNTWDENKKKLCVFAIWQTISLNTGFRALNLWINGTPVKADNEVLNTLMCAVSSLNIEDLYRTAIEHRMSTVYCANAENSYIIPVLAEYCEGDVQKLSDIKTDSQNKVSDDEPSLYFDCSTCFSNDGALLYCTAGENATAAEIAAAVMNAATNLPDAEGIRHSIGTKEDAGCEYYFTDAVNYLAAEIVSYTGETRYLAAADSENPIAILKLICGEYLNEGDIVNAYIDGDCAVIDLSGKYFEQIQKYDAGKERTCIFSIVNAVCNYSAADKVRFTVEGNSVESFAGNICIDSVIYPNYGM